MGFKAVDFSIHIGDGREHGLLKYLLMVGDGR